MVIQSLLGCWNSGITWKSWAKMQLHKGRAGKDGSWRTLDCWGWRSLLRARDQRWATPASRASRLSPTNFDPGSRLLQSSSLPSSSSFMQLLDFSGLFRPWKEKPLVLTNRRRWAGSQPTNERQRPLQTGLFCFIQFLRFFSHRQ